MRAKDILVPALRQYSHNTGEGLLFGYDKEEAEKVVQDLLRFQGELQALLIRSVRYVEHRRNETEAAYDNSELRGDCGLYCDMKSQEELIQKIQEAVGRSF